MSGRLLVRAWWRPSAAAGTRPPRGCGSVVRRSRRRQRRALSNAICLVVVVLVARQTPTPAPLDALVGQLRGSAWPRARAVQRLAHAVEVTPAPLAHAVTRAMVEPADEHRLAARTQRVRLGDI